MVEKIVDRALASLSANGVEVNRENWFQEAIEAEKSGAVHCCQAITKAIIESGVEEEDRKQTWIDDAEFVSIFFEFFEQSLSIYAIFCSSVIFSVRQKVHTIVLVLYMLMLCKCFHRKKVFGCVRHTLKRITEHVKV